MNEYRQLSSRQDKEEAAGLKSQLADFDRQIGHIVTAVSEGFTQPTFMQKLSELEEDKARLEVRILELQAGEEQPPAITEDTLRELFARFRKYVSTKNVPEIKKFIASYVEKVIIYNYHVEVIFKLNAAGVAIDGTNHENFAASVDKQKLFRLSSDAV